MCVHFRCVRFSLSFFFFFSCLKFGCLLPLLSLFFFGAEEKKFTRTRKALCFVSVKEAIEEQDRGVIVPIRTLISASFFVHVVVLVVVFVVGSFPCVVSVWTCQPHFLASVDVFQCPAPPHFPPAKRRPAAMEPQSIGYSTHLSRFLLLSAPSRARAVQEKNQVDRTVLNLQRGRVPVLHLLAHVRTPAVVGCVSPPRMCRKGRCGPSVCDDVRAVFSV